MPKNRLAILEALAESITVENGVVTMKIRSLTVKKLPSGRWSVSGMKFVDPWHREFLDIAGVVDCIKDNC